MRYFLIAVLFSACACHPPLGVTDEEHALLKNFFGSALDVDKIQQVEYDGTENECIGNVIFWPAEQDYGADRPSRYNILIHEASHVVQHQHHVDSPNTHTYQYRLLPEKHILLYEIEQQASLFQDLYSYTDWEYAEYYWSSRCLDCAAIGLEESLAIMRRRGAEFRMIP